MIGVIVYKCGRNINRVYRLCHIYGIQNLFLVGCDSPKIGNVFSAKGTVAIHIIDNLNGMRNIAALEKGKGVPICDKISEFDYLLVGGENVMLKNDMADGFFHIKTENTLCLTVDEALAIGLHYATG